MSLDEPIGPLVLILEPLIVTIGAGKAGLVRWAA
jgi:hypothetical protein